MQLLISPCIPKHYWEYSQVATQNSKINGCCGGVGVGVGGLECGLNVALESWQSQATSVTMFCFDSAPPPARSLLSPE